MKDAISADKSSRAPSIWPETIATGAAGLAIAAGGLVGVGWMFDVTLLTHFGLGDVRMAASTALCFALAGLALWLLWAGDATGAAPIFFLQRALVRRRVAQGLAWVVLLVGLITGTGHLVGRNFDLGRLFFSAAAMTGGAGAPNPMAPLTALDFILSGGALLALLAAPGPRRRRGLHVVTVAAGLVVAIAVTVLLDFAGGVPLGDGSRFSAGMAVPTAGLFVVFGAGVTATVFREAPMAWTIGPRITAAFAVGLLVLCAEIALIFRTTANLEATSRAVAHTNEVRFHISELHSLLQEMESMQRGYLVAGQELFLVPYLPATKTTATELATLGDLLASNPAQQQRLVALEPLVAAKLGFTAEAIEVFRRQGEQTAEELVRTGRGKLLMDEIIRLLVAMDDEEEVQAARHKADAETATDRALVLLPLGALTSIAIFVAVLLALNGAITVRQQAEQRLRLQGSALDATAHAIIITDRSGGIEWANAAFTRLSGYGVAEVIGRNPRQLVMSGRHDAAFYRSMWDTILAGRVWHGEILNRRKDGSVYPEEMTITPVRDESSEITHFVAVKEDITARQQTEAALRASEADFRLLAEAMPQIVWATRPDGWNVFFNRQWTEYTGLTLEESYGHGWNKPLHPDDQQRVWDAWQNATTNLATYSLECRLRRADGAYRWWLVRGVPVRDAAGNVLKWFGTCTDIHEMKLGAEELAQFNAAAVGRELRMIELKAEINDLARQLGRPPPHEMEFLTEVVPANASAPAANEDPTSR